VRTGEDWLRNQGCVPTVEVTKTEDGSAVIHLSGDRDNLWTFVTNLMDSFDRTTFVALGQDIAYTWVMAPEPNEPVFQEDEE
jgi:hypothetical protein